MNLRRRRRTPLRLVANNHTPEPAPPRFRLIAPVPTGEEGDRLAPEVQLPPVRPRHPANGLATRLNHLDAMRRYQERLSLGHVTEAMRIDVGSHQYQADTLRWAIDTIRRHV